MSANSKIFNVSSRFIRLSIFLLGIALQRVKYDTNCSTTPEMWSNKNLIGPILLFLKNFSLVKFNSLMDFSFQDYIGKKNRFLPFYVLQSYMFNVRLSFFSQVEESDNMISLTSVFNSSC